MSRTIRRKNGNQTRKSSCELSDFITDYLWIYVNKCTLYCIRKQYEKHSIEYKKGKAKFHSDSGTWKHKEPGPRWFRNLTSERPLRRKHKLEIYKFIKNPDYDPDIVSKGKLEYWT